MRSWILAAVAVALYMNVLVRPALAQHAGDLRPRIAVLNVLGSGDTGLDDAALDVLTEDIREEVVEVLRHWFDLITRENLDVLLRASGTDITRCQEGQCEIDVGRQIQAAVVVSGFVSRIGSNWILRLSAHRTETAAVLMKASAEASDFGRLRGEARKATRRILQEINRVMPRGAVAAAPADQTLGARPGAWTAPAVEMVVVSFASTPTGAVVQVDGRLACESTPCTKTIEAGTHTVVMQKSRYLERSEVARIESGNRSFHWELAPAFGWLTVRTRVDGLPIRLNGREVGRTPLSRYELDPGEHEVLASHPQYHDLGMRFVVERGQEKVLDLDPTPRQGALRVTAVDGKGNATGAQVQLDGRSLGAAPGQWTLLVGGYDLMVKSTAGVWKGNAIVREGEVTHVEAVTRGAFAGQCTRLDETRGDEMCFVPAGSFRAGCRTRPGVTCVKGEAEEYQGRTSGVWVDRHEVTVADYEECVRSGRCEQPLPGEACNWGRGRGRHPINCVGWEQARRYCDWAGKRLPEPDEWEKAARGEDGRLYPWGNQAPTCTLAVLNLGGNGCGTQATASVGSRRAGAGPYGHLDLAGNVWEWVGNTQHSLRGGSWVDGAGVLRSSIRLTDVPSRGFANTGFRCARFE